MFSGFLKNLNYTESLQDEFLIHNIYENNKKIKEIFSGFDINQFHPANDERKEKEEYR